MLAEALTLDGPSMIRFPKTPAPWVAPGHRGLGPRGPPGPWPVTARSASWPWARCVAAAEEAARRRWTPRGSTSTVWDVRVVSEPDPAMLADAGPPRRGDHRRGRRAPGRGRHVPRRGLARGAARWAPHPRSSRSASPAPSSPRASPTASWPGWASTDPVWRNRSGKRSPRSPRTRRGPARWEPTARAARQVPDPAEGPPSVPVIAAAPGYPRLTRSGRVRSRSQHGPPKRPQLFAARTETCSTDWPMTFNLADLFEAAVDAFGDREYLVAAGEAPHLRRDGGRGPTAWPTSSPTRASGPATTSASTRSTASSGSRRRGPCSSCGRSGSTSTTAT